MTLQNDDLLLVNRGGTSFKTEYGLLKQNISDGLGGAIVSEDEPGDDLHEGDFWYKPSTETLHIYVVNETTGVVTDVSVRNGGSGYNTSGTDVSTDGGSGSELTINYQAGVGGALANPTVNQGGHAYKVNDVVFVTGSGHANSTVNVTAVNTVAVGQWVDASPDGGGGVTSIIAGDGISVDQATGDVTITNTGGSGSSETTKADIYGTAKAWGNFDALGVLQEGSSNVSIAKTGLGSYQVTLSPPMSTADYAVTLGGVGDSSVGNLSTAGFTLYAFSSAGAANDYQQTFAVFDNEPAEIIVGSGTVANTNIFGTAKAWGKVAGNGTLNGGLNVASVTKAATGKYSVVFTTPMPNANYSLNHSANNISTILVTSQNLTTTGCDIIITNTASNTPIDSPFSFTVFDNEPAEVALTTFGDVINYSGAAAWGNVSNVGTLNNGLNCTVSGNGAVNTVVFQTPMPDANYSINITSTAPQVNYYDQTATGFKYSLFNKSGGAVAGNSGFSVFSSNVSLPLTVTQAEIDTFKSTAAALQTALTRIAALEADHATAMNNMNGGY